jgi:hypothetical protein
MVWTLAMGFAWFEDGRKVKRIVAISLATAALLWTCVWAAYLWYFGFSDWILDDSDGDSTAFAVVFLSVVTLIPAFGAVAGWLGACVRRGSGLITWIGSGVLGLFVLSPGLFGAPYLLSAVLMVAAAAFRTRATAPPLTT